MTSAFPIRPGVIKLKERKGPKTDLIRKAQIRTFAALSALKRGA